jgi:hypothetical protein
MKFISAIELAKVLIEYAYDQKPLTMPSRKYGHEVPRDDLALAGC